MPAEPPPHVPTNLEGFQVGERLRESGALAVHAGVDRLGLPVEIYVVAASALTGAFTHQDFLDRIRRAASVQHEALLPFVTGGVRDDLAFAVAKSVEGGGLDELIGRGGPLADERALLIGAAVASALAALEAAGLRHGDLTPRRIVLPGRGVVVLRPPRIVPHAVSPRYDRYQAPEEARREEGDIRSDLFVLGLIVVEALTATYPVAGGPAEARRALRVWPDPDMATLLPQAGPAACAVVGRLLAAVPARRFASAAEAARALRAAAAGEVPAPAAARIVEAPPETAPIAAAAAPIPILSELLPGPAPAVASPAMARRAPSAVPPGAPAVPAVPVRRTPGRLWLDARLGEAMLEIDEDVYVGHPAGALDVHALSEPFPEAAFRVERAPTGDVLHALQPGVTVGGAAVQHHDLAHGDRIQGPGVSARYERAVRAALRATGAGAAPPSPASRTRSRWVVIAAVSGTVVAVLGGALVVGSIRGRSAAAVAAADRAQSTVEPAGSVEKPVAPTGTADGARERAARDLYESAHDWARRNKGQTEEIRSRLLRVAERYPDTGHASLARIEASELGRRDRADVDKAYADVAAQAAADAAEGRLDRALRSLREYAEDNPATILGEKALREAVRLEAEIAARYDADMAKVHEAIARKDWRAATTLLDGVMEYVPISHRDETIAVRHRIEQAMNETLRGGGTPPPPGKPPGGAEGPGAPPGPGGAKPPDAPPDPGAAEAERRRRAEEAFRAARKLMDANKDEEALDAFLAFLREHKETVAGTKHDLEVRARITTLATGPAGITKLFHGKTERLAKGAWRLSYDFEDEAQFADFRDAAAFEAPPRAAWTRTSGAARAARGSGALLLDAVFRPEQLSMSVTVNPERPHDLGAMLVDPTEERRYYLFTLQNTFFALGRGAGAKTFEENAIVLFGPDMWRDTPAGQLGFVRKAGSAEPAVRPNDGVAIKAGKDKGEVWMRFEGGRDIRGSAYGDVKYDFPGLVPGVFVLGSSGFFDDFVVEGVPDPEWVAKRWRALLSGL